MNIFITNKCPIKSAQYLDDKRVIKMTLETAQLLSTAIHSHGGKATYKPTHASHPATIWTKTSKSNYMWVMRHFTALCREYTKRTGKTHACSKLSKELIDGMKHIPVGKLTPFVNCAANKDKGLDFKHLTDVHVAYKLYLDERWKTDKRLPKWSNTTNE